MGWRIYHTIDTREEHRRIFLGKKKDVVSPSHRSIHPSEEERERKNPPLRLVSPFRIRRTMRGTKKKKGGEGIDRSIFFFTSCKDESILTPVSFRPSVFFPIDLRLNPPIDPGSGKGGGIG